MRVTVSTNDLRLALKSVVQHVYPDNEMPDLHRVRLEVGPENVTVSATNRYTVGRALVSIWEHGDGDLSAFDLSPTDVKDVLAMFPKKAKADEMPDDKVEIEVTTKHAIFTDTSGLAKACRLLDAMEVHGVVGPAEGTNMRAVLITPGELQTALDVIRGRWDGQE